MKKYLLLMIILGVFAPIKADAQEAKKFLNIQEVKSPGGIKAWLVEDHTVPVIALEFSFRDSGAKTDPEGKQGRAQLASNTMDEGAGELTSEQFQKELQDLSLSLTFNADRDNFGGSLKTLSANKKRAFELLSLAVNEPRFDEEPVNRMRAANQSRIKGSMSNPKWIAARLQNDRLFEGHPYAKNSGGTLSSLAALTPSDLKEFHKTLGKNRLVVSVAGDITATELAPLLDQIFGALPDVPAPPDDKTTLKNAGKTYIFDQDIPQTIIEIAQNGIGREDPDYHTAQIMNFILGGSGFGSRLTDEIREKRGLTYGIFSFFREYEATKVFHVSTSTENKNIQDMITLIKAEWKKMKETPVSEKELQDAKSYLIGSLPLSLTSTNAIAELMLSLQLDNLPTDYLDTREATLRTITTADIQRTAQKLLDENSLTIVLVGKPEGIENAEIITQLPNVE
jgi:zinc protease